MTSEMIVGIAGVVLSLLFSYIPGLRVWYAGLASEKKQLLMLGILVVVTGGIFGLSCGNYIPNGVSCDRDGAVKLIWMLVLAVTSNQAAYMITPPAADVISAKQARDEAAG